MPSSHLWAVNCLGNVYTLAVREHCWKKLQCEGLEFKRVAAIPQCVWAIGGDHQLYIFVPSGDVPIRWTEVAFENERWNPFKGFTSNLLPTDRPHWSSEDGLLNLPKDSFTLPTEGWEWEDDWYIEPNLNGQPLGVEGWMYALDFPLVYVPEKGWKSMVRRRKWIRHRRYVRTNSWVKVPGIYEDMATEPFVDVSIGGYDIPGGDPEVLCVWAVTILGRAVFREGVNRQCPEGKEWVHAAAATPSGIAEVQQISVGPTGLVWAVTWHGDVLVRTGVTRHQIMGLDWTIVKSPDEEHRVLQVAVGADVVWAITRDNKVWFRTGIKGAEAGLNHDSAVGNSWISMVGDMSLITVGPKNQVWGLDQDGITMWYRTDVSYSELSGRTWKPIRLPVSQQPRRCGSASSLSSLGSVSQQRDSDTDSYKEYTLHSSPQCSRQSTEEKKDEHDYSYPSLRFMKPINIPHVPCRKPSSAKEMAEMLQSFSKMPSSAHSSCDDDFDSIYDNPEESSEFHQNRSLEHENSEESGQEQGKSHVTFADSKVETVSETVQVHCSINDSVPLKLDHCAAGWAKSDSTDSAYADEDCDAVATWTWISGTACITDAQSMTHWFKNAILINEYENSEEWRMIVLSRLRARFDKSVKEFSFFPEAIEKSTWIKTGTCRFLESSRSQNWVPSLLSLERFEAGEAEDVGILKLSYLVGKDKMLCFKLAELTCILNASNKEKRILAIHSPSLTSARKPVKLNFTNDTDVDDWVATLNIVCTRLRKLPNPVGPTAIWSTTTQGDVYVCEPNSNLERTSLNSLFWKLLGGGHLLLVETCPAGIAWGLGYNNTPWVYTGGFGGGPFKGVSGYNVRVNPISDVRHVYIYENQRWNPLTSFSSKGLPTDRYMWSDETGRYCCTKENTKLPSCHWQWISDWAIDFNAPGGVDNDGWQYASDFPRTYYPQKAFTHYVRRRRWYRKCQLNSSGPWKELPSTPLISISMQLDVPDSPRESIAVWGVANNGVALCRLGVTTACPEGVSWFPVPADQPFTSISVGGGYLVWAVGKNGMAFLRNGVSPTCPTGQVWFQIEPPESSFILRQISVGKTSVFAVDTGNNLWYRKDIMPLFPEGTSWVPVSDHIRQISVGPEDQVWAVADTLQTSSGAIHGVICRRTGITPENKIGTGWEYGIGGGWQHVSIRGCSQDAEIK